MSERISIVNGERKFSKIKKAVLGFIALTGVLLPLADTSRSDDVILTHEKHEDTIGNEVTIMTTNVHSWQLDGKNNYDRFAEKVIEHDPDIICMQEVLADTGELEKLHGLGYDVYFHATYHHPLNMRFGNAVAAKTEIEDVNTTELPDSGFTTPRVVTDFMIMTEQGPIWVGSTHIETGKVRSSSQIKFMGEKLGSKIDFGCGDYNQSSDLLGRSALGSMLNKNSGRSAYNTFPSSKPRIRLDYVLAQECNEQVGPTIVFDFGSDHMGLTETYDTTNCRVDRY